MKRLKSRWQILRLLCLKMSRLLLCECWCCVVAVEWVFFRV
ncbi:hypothetical protein HanPI659440_Chr05g0207971 [Helianthus annuus]|nr:hypothetical protein HanPI659440_Chr05g0207971 [Helianthus annuus]